MFWQVISIKRKPPYSDFSRYLHRRVDNNVWEAKTVFCSPSIKMSAVHAEAWLQSKTLASCQEKDELKLDNSITGSPLFGQAFNGYVRLFSNYATASLID